MSSSKEVNESLICVDGNRIIHLMKKGDVQPVDHTQYTCMPNAFSEV